MDATEVCVLRLNSTKSSYIRKDVIAQAILTKTQIHTISSSFCMRRLYLFREITRLMQEEGKNEAESVALLQKRRMGSFTKLVHQLDCDPTPLYTSVSVSTLFRCVSVSFCSTWSSFRSFVNVLQPSRRCCTW